MTKLRVFLTDDHSVLRQGLKLLVNAQPDMEVIGEASDGEEAVRMIPPLKPDVVIMDVSMPRLNGYQATEQLKKVLPRLKVLALTRHSAGSYLQQLLRAGVDGYVLKQSEATEFVRAIRAIVAGGTYLDPSVAGKLIDNFAGRLDTTRAPSAKALSEREAEVLRLIARGYSNKEIASRFNLSVKTVEVHKANAMKKLDLRSRIDIVRYAILQGWLAED